HRHTHTHTLRWVSTLFILSASGQTDTSTLSLLGNPQSACLLFYNLREPVALNIILEYNETLRDLTYHLLTSTFISFQVPPAGSRPLAFITFSVTGATIKLSERRSVAIQNTDNIVFVQTDKPIYKPGQKGEEGT
uniref:Uncharacterized protein n=1 Tax=Crocodylus porosus TaxID=8502 RepID=A0A7M4FYW3_CROPO